MSGAYTSFPERLPGTVDGELRYWSVLEGWYAVAGAGLPGAAFTLDDEGIGVYRGEVPDAYVETAMPIYSAAPHGGPLVATGVVFVRFAEGIPATARQKDFDRAGYVILEIPDYAPHAAWIKAQTGSILDALNGLTRLIALPDMRTVEPQLIAPRALRG